MINQKLLDMLIRLIKTGKIVIDDILDPDYKEEIKNLM